MMNQYNQANALQYDEQRERSRARNDMARGDIYGAVTHQARAKHDHARRDKILEEQALSMGDYQRAAYLHREANSFENAAGSVLFAFLTQSMGSKRASPAVARAIRPR